MDFKTYDVAINKAKVIAIKRKHPWVFSGALRLKEKIENGSIIRLIDNFGNYLATGYYQNASIAVRILDFMDNEIDNDFWLSKVIAAIKLRQSIGLIENQSTNCFRLVNGEGDGIPGVIIDHYDGYLVLEVHASSFEVHIPHLVKALNENGILTIKEVIIRRKYGEKTEMEKLVINVKENDIQFEIDISHGQKTGFFLDQRDNRALLAKYAKGRKLLNLFCYTGGFSLYGLKNGSTEVHSVDISGSAIERLASNVAINELADQDHELITEDVKEYLKSCQRNYFDLVVVDPPAFAKSVKKRHNAVQAYKRLNAQVMELIKEGGIMFTFSCSQVVDNQLFEHTIRAAALEVGREIKILQFLSQSNDHPINIYHKEGRYLKGLVLHVS